MAVQVSARQLRCRCVPSWLTAAAAAAAAAAASRQRRLDRPDRAKGLAGRMAGGIYIGIPCQPYIHTVDEGELPVDLLPDWQCVSCSRCMHRDWAAAFPRAGSDGAAACQHQLPAPPARAAHRSRARPPKSVLRFLRALGHVHVSRHPLSNVFNDGGLDRRHQGACMYKTGCGREAWAYCCMHAARSSPTRPLEAISKNTSSLSN